MIDIATSKMSLHCSVKNISLKELFSLNNDQFLYYYYRNAVYMLNYDNNTKVVTCKYTPMKYVFTRARNSHCLGLGSSWQTLSPSSPGECPRLHSQGNCSYRTRSSSNWGVCPCSLLVVTATYSQPPDMTTQWSQCYCSWSSNYLFQPVYVYTNQRLAWRLVMPSFYTYRMFTGVY